MDHYVLALQDGRSFGQPVSEFTLHGLWPGDSVTGTSPVQCRVEALHANISTEVPLLATYWPNYNSRSNNQAFWSHEWEKHGSCSGLAQKDYFIMAVQLAQNSRVRHTLNTLGRLPSGTPIQAGALNTTVRSCYKVYSDLRCKPLGTKNVLGEVWFNFTNDAAAPTRQNFIFSFASNKRCQNTVELL